MFAKYEFTESLGGLATIAPAVPDRRLRVRRLLFASDVGGSLKWVANPAGTPSDLSSLLYFAANRPLDLTLHAEDGIVGGVGEGLGVNLTAFGVAADYSICIWYEQIT